MEANEIQNKTFQQVKTKIMNMQRLRQIKTGKMLNFK